MKYESSQLDQRLFQRQDDSPDSVFYAQPRKVVHIDLGAIEAVTALYRELLPKGGAILDLMSSWRSHLPQDASRSSPENFRTTSPKADTSTLLSMGMGQKFSGQVYGRVCGLGMNEEELDDNPQLTDWLVHDLNQDPSLPFADGEFSGACCCVSIQYVQRPQELFAEVARVLAPDAPFIVTFSNRCFPTKAINAWCMTNDAGHTQLVGSYFTAEPSFRDCTIRNVKPTFSDAEHQNPLYAVWGYKQDNS